MFTTSHPSKSKYNSSKRTQECARLLNVEMRLVYKNLKKILLFLFTWKKNFNIHLDYSDVLMKKSIGLNLNYSFNSKFNDRVIWFSAKDSPDDEPDFLKKQMDEKYLIEHTLRFRS